MGTLTIFLPCGVTQAMMAAALGAGSALQGGSLMFAFILGTTPLFFTVSYFATRLSAAVEKHFTRIVAITMLILGLVSVDAGLNLTGSPFSFTRVYNIALASARGIQTGFEVNVTDDGYEPVILHLPANQPISIDWVTDGTKACTRSVVVPDLQYQYILPTTGRVSFEIPAQATGTVINYSCSMGMYPSQLIFDLENK